MLRLISKAYLAALLFSVTLLASGAAFAAARDDMCRTTMMDICGVRIKMQAGGLGTIRTIKMPKQFLTRTLLLECVTDSVSPEYVGSPYYKILQDTQTACARRVCPDGSINVCGINLPVSGGVAAGDAKKVPIPDNLLTTTARTRPPNVYASCEIEDDIAQYAVKDEYSVPCLSFSCQPEVLSACDSSVRVLQEGDLGTVFHLKMDDGRAATVQCLSTDGHAPRFDVIDCY